MTKHKPLPINNGNSKSKDLTLPLAIGLAASIIFTTVASFNGSMRVTKLANDAIMEQVIRDKHDIQLLRLAELNKKDSLENGKEIANLSLRIENLVDAIDKQKKLVAKQAQEIKELVRVAPSTYRGPKK